MRTALLGLPRIGRERELKFALEDHWAGRSAQTDLLEQARALRRAGWERARDAGIDIVPSGDFSLYDHVLDTAWAVGAIPERFGDARARGLDGYFALARGSLTEPPLQATKWFDTNYHHLVPEFAPGRELRACADHWTQPLREAAQLGIATRPVLLGPLSLVALSKRPELRVLDALVPVYEDLLRELAAAGAREVQVDEPCLVLDRDTRELDAFATAWRALHAATSVELCLATYFAAPEPLDLLLALPMAEVHLDLVRAPAQLAPALARLGNGAARLSLGIVDGRNVWRTDLDAARRTIQTATAALGPDRITLAPSCSLLHVPYDARRETGLEPAVRDRLAFAAERMHELTTLRDGTAAAAAARPGPVRANPEVHARVAALTAADYERASPASARRELQRTALKLPELPATTIGSFPQTPEIRAARRRLRDGSLDPEGYEGLMLDEIARIVAEQERLGLDVLVHGEPERDDMVESFADQLEGFALSAHGWVQSFGSGCVKPPILHGDVSRRGPMTVRWWRHAQSLTSKPLKGMLTGPVTLLQWSFARDDQPRARTCTQIALAMRDELRDLERAGARIIQVDEPALREGLPLGRAERDAYLRWAVDCFRLTVGAAAGATQIHTHMCYAEIGHIVGDIARMDADVLSIEAARSGPAVLDALAAAPMAHTGIGPGVYDTHSPRIPTVQEIERLLAQAEERVGRDRLWVNPDCGLKSRSWDEACQALERLMHATRARRDTARP